MRALRLFTFRGAVQACPSAPDRANVTCHGIGQLVDRRPILVRPARQTGNQVGTFALPASRFMAFDPISVDLDDGHRVWLDRSRLVRHHRPACGDRTGGGLSCAVGNESGTAVDSYGTYARSHLSA